MVAKENEGGSYEVFSKFHEAYSQLFNCDQQTRMSYALYLDNPKYEKRKRALYRVSELVDLFEQLVETSFSESGLDWEVCIKELATLIVTIDDDHSLLLAEYTDNVEEVAEHRTRRHRDRIIRCIVDNENKELEVDQFRVKEHIIEHFVEVLEGDWEVIDSMIDEMSARSFGNAILREITKVGRISLGVASGIVIANRLLRRRDQ